MAYIGLARRLSNVHNTCCVSRKFFSNKWTDAGKLDIVDELMSGIASMLLSTIAFFSAVLLSFFLYSKNKYIPRIDRIIHWYVLGVFFGVFLGGLFRSLFRIEFDYIYAGSIALIVVVLFSFYSLWIKYPQLFRYK